MKRLALVLAPLAAAAALTAGVVVAQPHGSGHHPPCVADFPSPEHHQEMLDHVSKVLGLSDAQRAAIEKIHEKRRPALEPLFERQAKLHDQVEAALERGAKPAEVGNLVIAAHKVKKELMAAHDDMRREAEKVLDPAQVEKLRALMAQLHGH